MERKQGSRLSRNLTVAFLLFPDPAGGSNPLGPISQPCKENHQHLIT